MTQRMFGYGTHEPQTGDKRSDHRRRVLKSGTIHFNGGYASYGCQVRNLTPHGAMAEMGETTGIPQEFLFSLDGQEKVSARLVWRTQTRIGLQLLG